jgi:type VI secretion system protein ImpH
MAAAGRGTDSPLTQLLFDEPYRFEFFQAVRLLERLNPGRGPVGRDGDPRDEAARFRAHASLAFPPSQICRIDEAGGGDGGDGGAR